MSLISIIVMALSIVLIFLMIRFLVKTLKLVIVMGIIIIIFGVWLYGFSGIFNKISDVKDSIPELGIQTIARSITGCTTEQDCAYIISPGDCRMTAEYCNNVFKEENYLKVQNEQILGESCNRTSVEINYTVDCECKLHKEREGKIKQWLSQKLEKKAGYTYCWKKELQP